MNALKFYSKKSIVNELAISYAETPNFYHTASTFIKDIKNVLPIDYCFTDKTLIDLGAGTGKSISVLSSLGFKKVIAVDGSDEMIKHILKMVAPYYPHIQMQVLQANLETDRISVDDSSVDIAICCNVFTYLSSIENIFSEASRILKPSGLFSFEIDLTEENKSNLSWIDGNKVDCHVFGKQYFESLIGKYCFKKVSETYKQFNNQPGFPIYNPNVLLCRSTV